MSSQQNARLSTAEKAHKRIVESFPLYEETAHWHPVLCNRASWKESLERKEWADNRGLLRGTVNARNDYMVPVDGLWIFKDAKVAMEFKLLWG